MSHTLASVIGLLLAGTTWAHPFHVSLAEAEWNAESKKLEIALRLHPTDLEDALSQRAKQRISLETTEDVDSLIRDYLAEAFVVTDTDDTPATLEWVGKEIEVTWAWVYFEIPLQAGPDGVTIRNAVFFELLEDQANLITLRSGKQRHSLTFTRDDPEATVSLKANPKP